MSNLVHEYSDVFKDFFKASEKVLGRDSLHAHLTQAQKEWIFSYVSGKEGCVFCRDMHLDFSRFLGADDEPIIDINVVDRLIAGEPISSFSESQHAMCKEVVFVISVTRFMNTLVTAFEIDKFSAMDFKIWKRFGYRI